jgi:hypothetical protein
MEDAATRNVDVDAQEADDQLRAEAYDQAHYDLQYTLRLRRLDVLAVEALGRALARLTGEQLVCGVYDGEAPGKLCEALVKIAERLAEPLEIP